MPAVGMRRTTRIFGVVKRVEGARVLRSGRRIWPDAREAKLKRGSERDEWCRLIRSTGHGHKPGKVGADVSGHIVAGSTPKHADPKEGTVHDEDSEYDEDDPCVKKRRRIGIEVVYCRKRTRPYEQNLDALPAAVDKKYGIKYQRKRRKKQNVDNGILVGLVVAAVIDSSRCPAGFFECFLRSVLGYMWEKKISLTLLARFILSQPICGVYTEHGIRFLKDAPINAKGICKFFSDGQLVPFFSVDFSAVPLCFIHMHQALLLQEGLRSFTFVHKSSSLLLNGEITSTTECHPVEESENDPEALGLKMDGQRNKEIPQPPGGGGPKIIGRNGQHRNGLSSRSFRRRRSSFGRRRARNVSGGVYKVTASSSPSKLAGSKRNGKKNSVSFSPVVPQYKLRSTSRDNLCSKSKANAATLDVKQDIESLSCSANILVTESDRCYREEGVTVTLELFSSMEWHLVAKKDGSIRYTHKAQMTMRPCSSNRVTHAIMWTGDDGWKLEFCNRQDWSIFKDLYKECSNRNASASNVKSIPVPGVSEVSGYMDESNACFRRPVSYISVKDDEISRALAKRSAIYDMDSADEEWLKKFNVEHVSENDHLQSLSEDSFELMIDGFEKSLFCSPEDFSEEKAVSSLSHLGRREVVDAVYHYWMRKRKQRRASLLRIFQGHHGKKDPVVLKPVLRKKRSFKRQASQPFGRGKRTILLQLAAEKNAVEQRDALHRLEEAKVRSNSSLEAAIAKRQRAQLLMKNADLATYKAMMALRIAEAARMAEAGDSSASDLLDLDRT